MIFKNIEIEMDLTIDGTSKPYFVYADIDVEFEFDDDWEPWIEKISFDDLIIVDRYNDSIQYNLDSEKVTKQVKDDVRAKIEERDGEEYINDFIMQEMDDFKGGQND